MKQVTAEVRQYAPEFTVHRDGVLLLQTPYQDLARGVAKLLDAGELTAEVQSVDDEGNLI